MNHQEARDKWVGNRYRQTVKLGYQCVAWAIKYVAERWRTPLKRFWGVGAYQWWVNNNGTFDVKSYQKVANDPNLVPSQGDIIIFKQSKGNWWHWHIAVVDSADINYVTVIEQNAVEWNGDWEWWDEIRIHTYNYDWIVGRWHYKGSTPVVPMPDPLIQQLIDNWIYNWQEWDGVTYRNALMMAKLYDKLLKLTWNK